jgi:hypothetical protein
VGGEVSLAFVVSSSAAERCDACSSRETVSLGLVDVSGQKQPQTQATAGTRAPPHEPNSPSKATLLYSNAEVNATVRV